MEELAARGVRVLAYAASRIRLVTHRGIDDAAVERTLSVFAALLN